MSKNESRGEIVEQGRIVVKFIRGEEMEADS
jgi:hypothetical protein